MVQHTIPAKTSDRRTPAGSPSRTETQWLVERGMGQRRGSRMVFEDGGSAAPARSPAAGFFDVVPRLFRGRFQLRASRQGQILERPEGSRPPFQNRRRAL